MPTDEPDLQSLLIRSRFDDPAERRAHARGELVRVAPGRYVESVAWRGLRREERHALRTVAAVGRMRDEVVVSHTSAAAVWGMPVLGPPLARVSTTDPARARTHTGAHVTRHAARLPSDEITRHRGLVVTTPARTAVDVALTGTHSQAVAVLDHCLRRRSCTLDEYQACLLGRDRVRGSTRASWVAEFASPSAGSAGESVYRVALDGLEFPGTPSAGAARRRRGAHRSHRLRVGGVRRVRRVRRIREVPRPRDAARADGGGDRGPRGGP